MWWGVAWQGVAWRVRRRAHLRDSSQRVERHVWELVALVHVHVRLLRPLGVLLHLQHRVQQALHRLPHELVVHHRAAHQRVLGRTGAGGEVGVQQWRSTPSQPTHPLGNRGQQLDAHAAHVLVQCLGAHHLYRGRHQGAQVGGEEAGAQVRHVGDGFQARNGVGALARVEAVADDLQHQRHQRLQLGRVLLPLHHAQQVGQRLQRLRPHAALVLRVAHGTGKHGGHGIQQVLPAVDHVVGQQREDAERGAAQGGLGRCNCLIQEGEQLRPEAVLQQAHSQLADDGAHQVARDALRLGVQRVQQLRQDAAGHVRGDVGDHGLISLRQIHAEQVDRQYPQGRPRMRPQHLRPGVRHAGGHTVPARGEHGQRARPALAHPTHWTEGRALTPMSSCSS